MDRPFGYVEEYKNELIFVHGNGDIYFGKKEKKLQKKSDDFNERYKKKLGYGVTVGKLKAVFQRGLGAFNVSRSPRVSSASQWAFARVNSFVTKSSGTWGGADKDLAKKVRAAKK